MESHGCSVSDEATKRRWGMTACKVDSAVSDSKVDVDRERGAEVDLCLGVGRGVNMAREPDI